MTSEADYQKPALEGAGKAKKPFLTLDGRDIAFLGLTILLGCGIVSALMDDSEDIRRREWTAACVTTVGGASGKVGELTDRGAYVAFADGARVWYPMAELEKADCVTLFPVVPEPASSPSTEIEDASRSNRDILNARKELELLTLKLEQARLARELYNTMQSDTGTAKP